MITLIIKGTMEQATSAAEMRNVPVVPVHERDGDVTVETADHYIENVMQWFCELPICPPFPVGACLHYSLTSADKPRD